MGIHDQTSEPRICRICGQVTEVCSEDDVCLGCQVHTEDEITDQMAKDYVQGGWEGCLFCKSIQVEGGPVEIDGNLAWQDMHCNDCGRSWRDCYTLTGVISI